MLKKQLRFMRELVLLTLSLKARKCRHEYLGVCFVCCMRQNFVRFVLILAPQVMPPRNQGLFDKLIIGTMKSVLPQQSLEGDFLFPPGPTTDIRLISGLGVVIGLLRIRLRFS